MRRFIKPLRDRRRWPDLATFRFETDPGAQPKVDFGRSRVDWGVEQSGTSSVVGRDRIELSTQGFSVQRHFL
jgi:hypothetical protein